MPLPIWGCLLPAYSKRWEKTSHNINTDVRRVFGHPPWTRALPPRQGLPFLLGVWLTQCPTCYQKAWKGHVCPAGLIPFIISSTFIRIALPLLIKERTMTPIYTQLNTLAILREWLLTPFYKEPVGLKHENSHPISIPSPSQAKEQKWKPLI